MKQKIIFATGNHHKAEEVKYVLKSYSLDVKHLNIKSIEIQADTVGEIAKRSALQTTIQHKTPVLVEDTGLFIEALSGFPGPYAAYAYKTIGANGILKLLEEVDNRRVIFRSAVAFCDLTEKITCFIGECSGIISTEERGERGFGFDCIFEPLDVVGKTFAEMKLEEKSAISHRFYAIRSFADWYIKQLNVYARRY